MALLTRKRVLAAKIETTPGTAISLGTADATFNVMNPVIQDNTTMIERQRAGGFANLASTPGPYVGTCTFETDLEWDGSATEPAWAETFLPACGWVKSAGTYTDTDEVPGSNVKTLTIGCYVDGLYKQLRGAMGTFQVIGNSGEPGRIQWTFTGIFDLPSDVTLIAPTHTTDEIERWAGMTSTWNSRDICKSAITLDAGNQVIPIPCATDASGIKYFVVSNRLPVASADPLGNTVSAAPFHTERRNKTTAEIDMLLTGWAGDNDTLRFQMPAAQIVNLQEADREGLYVENVTWESRYHSTGMMPITFSVTA